MRVRHITQDDAHIFCTEDQIQEEVQWTASTSASTSTSSSASSPSSSSRRARRSASAPTRCGTAPRPRSQGALDNKGLEYEVNPGDGAFYGPKIDLHMTDSLGRSWQLGTVQLDYSMPERFDLTYTGADNDDHRAGDDPPRAVRLVRALHRDPDRALRAASSRSGSRRRRRIVLPVTDRHNDDALRSAPTSCSTHGLRASVDDRTESVGRKIREAELRKVPYMLVVGDREAESGTVARA